MTRNPFSGVHCGRWCPDLRDGNDRICGKGTQFIQKGPRCTRLFQESFSRTHVISLKPVSRNAHSLVSDDQMGVRADYLSARSLSQMGWASSLLGRSVVGSIL
ncbi:hypothetical protein GCM10010214_19940 [Streptomyces abikoensis]|nr:hypothetical protein GCM10010214_19940 [Streptomyces abikoensis]